MGSSTEHSRTAARSTRSTRAGAGWLIGGSAALVAAGAVPAALGSETGVGGQRVAVRRGGDQPTYGRVSRYGLVAFGSSLDQIGVLGRSVHDAARVLSVISGRGPKDATCEDRDSLRLPRARVAPRLRDRVPKEYFPQDLDPAVRRACDRAIRLLRELGAAVREVSLPHGVRGRDLLHHRAAEASSNWRATTGPGTAALQWIERCGARYRTTRGEGFGPEVRRRVLVGTYVLSSGYYDAYYGRPADAPR